MPIEESDSARPLSRPVILTVPGIMNSGPGHWQTIWETFLPDCRRVDLGSWDRPHRNSWVSKLGHAIDEVDGPVLLAAHSLGCHAVAWWAALACDGWSEKVVGALLVAPPEVGSEAIDDRLHGFAPLPQKLLPFPSILTASRNDPYMSFEQSRALAKTWGCRFAEAGEAGHINAQSQLGSWPFGRFLLSRLSRGFVPQGVADRICWDEADSDGASDGPAHHGRADRRGGSLSS
jgi:predicted alpha/beta hydrolase family esterase